MLRAAFNREMRKNNVVRRRAQPLIRQRFGFEALEERVLLTAASSIHRAVATAFLPAGVTRADVLTQLNAPAAVSRPLPAAALVTIGETEPNNSAATADAIPLGFDAGEAVAVDVTGSIGFADHDYFAIQLNPGDILGANVSGGATALSFRNSADVELIGSAQDRTSGYPDISPLPGGGNASLSWVADTAGTYFVRALGGNGAYNLNLRVFRPELEKETVGTHQILFLDFDGATIDMSIFGASGNATLSPLSSFLGGWGLNASDESAVIDSIIAAVTDNLSQDMRTVGNNGNFDSSGTPGQFDIEILNSRDHADPFGKANVSRIIIGGTIAQFGIPTVGLAESIDVGNFDTTETAVVLLDLLSAPASGPASLNQFPLGGGATIFDIIGAGVGNIVAHEAGHYFGNWHTNQFNSSANIMDQGGNLPGTIGIGPDGIFGTFDDVDVDFGNDAYVPSEGFTGIEHTLQSIAFGLSSGKVGLSISDATVFEGDSGTVDAVFEIKLASPIEQTMLIGYATADGTAVAPSDYLAQAGTLTFLPGGPLVQTVTIKVVGELAVEQNETFLVQLLDSVTGSPRITGVGTILNDDVELTINDITVVEGDSGTKNAVFVVSAFGAINRVITVGYGTVNDSANGASDYLPRGGTVTLFPGSTSTTITVPIVGDKLNEDTEQFAVLLTSAINARIIDALGVATIIDNDALPGFYVSDAYVTTMDAGLLMAVFTVAIDAPSGRDVTITYATADSSAVDGVNYIGQAGLLTFTPGVTSRLVSIPVLTDEEYVPNLKFVLNVSNPTNAVVVDPQGAATIIYAPEPTNEFIIDNGALGYSHSLNGWTTLTNTLAYQLDYDYASAGNGSATATWNFNDIPNGSYQVFAKWIPFGNRATNAPFTILNGATPLSTVLVNQQAGPSGDLSNGVTWQSLGTFETTVGNLAVRLANSANGYVIADAVRIVGGGIGPQAPEMDVAGFDRSIRTGDVTPALDDATDFGTVPQLIDSSEHLFTIFNSGNADLHLTGSPVVSITGANAADFQLITQPATTILPGRNTTFSILFHPLAGGLRTATVSIANSDDSEHPYTFALQGTGFEEEPTPPPVVTFTHNAEFPEDVNGDNRVSPGDLLIVINEILSRPASASALSVAPLAASSTPHFVDVNGDGRVSPNDALWVINYLLSPKVAPAAAGANAVASALAATAPETDEEASAAVLLADDGDETDTITASGASAMLSPAGVEAVLASDDSDDLTLDVDVEEFLAAI